MKNQKGFTLIELMLVIAICGILAAVIVPCLDEGNRQVADTPKYEVGQMLTLAINPDLGGQVLRVSCHKHRKDNPSPCSYKVRSRETFDTAWFDEFELNGAGHTTHTDNHTTKSKWD